MTTTDEKQATPPASRSGDTRKAVVFTTEDVIHTHNIFLSEAVVDAKYNLDILQVLRSCDEHDVVNFYLNNYGGDCAAGTQLINTLIQCKSKNITVYVDASVYSMASIFVVAAFKLANVAVVLGDDIMFMFHNYSGGVFGKGHEQLSAVKADEKLFNQADFNRLLPFLSTDEIKRMHNGEDFYFMKEEIMRRLENTNNFMSGRAYYDGDKLIEPKKAKRVKQ